MPEAVSSGSAVVKSVADYDAVSSQPGLVVIDVYSKFAGPCEAIVAAQKKWKSSYGELLKFHQAECDDIASLDAFHNKSMPTFLIFANGVLVDIVQGVNTPYLETFLGKAVELLKAEKLIPAYNGPLSLTGFNAAPVATEAGITAKRPSTAADKLNSTNTLASSAPDGQQQVLMIIKPNAVTKASEILEIIRVEGFTIAEQKSTVLTKKLAKQLYAEHDGKPFFDNLVQYMISGTVIALRLFRADAVEKLRSMMGPANGSRAREDAPTSLRGRFGSDGLRNGIHGSASVYAADRELAMLFSEDVKPVLEPYSTRFKVAPCVEKVVLVVRPEVVGFTTLGASQVTSLTNLAPGKSLSLSGLQSAHKSIHDLNTVLPESDISSLDTVVHDVLLAGLKIVATEQTVIRREHLAHILHNLSDDIVELWSSGTSVILLLSGDHAYEVVKNLVGPLSPEQAKATAPDCLCARFGANENQPGFFIAPDKIESAKLVDVFFPTSTEGQAIEKSPSSMLMENTFALLKPDVSQSKTADEIIEVLKENGFFINQQRQLTLTESQVRELYSEHAEKSFFRDISDFMTGGPVTILGLSRANAIVGLRELMGPADPERAKESAPKSIRARFGTSIVSNAMYGADSLFKAQHDLNYFLAPPNAADGPTAYPPAQNLELPDPSPLDQQKSKSASHNSLTKVKNALGLSKKSQSIEKTNEKGLTPQPPKESNSKLSSLKKLGSATLGKKSSSSNVKKSNASIGIKKSE
eukprot:Partr_v1_DN27792_c1_g1_i1_m67815 putative NME NM23 family member